MRLPFGLGRSSSPATGHRATARRAGSARRPGSSAADAVARLGKPAADPADRRSDAARRRPGRRSAARCPGSQALPPIVQPLGHEVSSLATPGLVVARGQARLRPLVPEPSLRRSSAGSRRLADGSRR